MGVSSILDLGQKESGIYKILDKANVYLMVQAIFGGEKSRQSFVEQNISLSPGMNVLDVGSGTSDIVDHLPNCNYFAFELSGQFGGWGQCCKQILQKSKID